MGKIPTPLRKNVLVKQNDLPVMTESGIYVNIFNSKRDKHDTGVIISVSPKVENLKVGDIVLYGKYSGVYVQYEDTEYLLLSESEVLATVDSDDVKNIKVTKTYDITR